MHALLSDGLAWLKRQRALDAQVLPHALRYNLVRFRLLSGVAVMTNCVYMFSFWVLDQSNSLPRSHEWANWVGWCHFIMALVSAGFGLAMHHMYRKGKNDGTAALVLVLLYMACAMVFGIGLTVADQLVMNSTTNFAVLSLLITVTAILPPLVSVPFFVLSFLACYHALSLTAINPEVLLFARSQAAAPMFISIIASVFFWLQYCKEVMLRTALTNTNKELAQRQQELEDLASYDSLTGLYLRRRFNPLAALELARASRAQASTTLLIIDLDFFKRVNDEHGHPAGDAVLRQVAQLILGTVRSTDLVGRLGGEEFIVLLCATSVERALNVAEKLRIQIAATPMQLSGGTQLSITASFGVCHVGPGQTGTLDDLYACADRALYQAKHLGRNRVELGHLPAGRPRAV